MTDASIPERLRALGRGEPLGADSSWWTAELDRRLPDLDEGATVAGLRGSVQVVRDARGVPHILADDDHDLFVGYGYATAQDRLFQLDIQRRKGRGRLAALVGPDGVELDRIALTIDFAAVLERQVAALDVATRSLLEAYAIGVNRWAATALSRDALPVEYALLGAAWEPWTWDDALAAALTWRWQLTGRTHVYAGPELLLRHLGDARWVDEILRASNEADTPIMPPDAPYPERHDPTPLPATGWGPQSAGLAGDASGSNNWVIGGSRSRSGLPLLASDPHMPYQAWSSFFEVGLHGGSFDAVGAGLVGMPALLFGRNRHLAWGITNNICSLRDLYQERPAGTTDDGRPLFAYDGSAEPATVRDVRIEVRDADPVTFRVVRTRNGPLVDDLLPPQAAETGPVSMRWLGTEVCDWTAALLRLDRAGSVRDAMAACDGWLVPTFSLLVGDTAGDIGYLATGRIPQRALPSRTYRPGWDPAHQWLGLTPADGMPRAISPAQDWLGSANNRPVPDDYPYPLFGTWDEGLRQRRIERSIVEGGPAGDGAGLGLEDLTGMHADVRSLRSEETLAAMIQLFGDVADERTQGAVALLRAWDGDSRIDSGGAAVAQVLTFRWAQACIRERVPDRDLADYLAGWSVGWGSVLLSGDPLGWFAPGRREEVARTVLEEAVEELSEAMGADPTAWSWGGIHQLLLPHALSARGDLGRLLDKGPIPVPGDLATLNNSGFDAKRGPTGWWATSGAGYRLEVDLGEQPAAAWSITGESQSALAGSPHHDDQRSDYVAGRVHRLPLDRVEIERDAIHELRLVPQGGAA